MEHQLDSEGKMGLLFIQLRTAGTGHVTMNKRNKVPLIVLQRNRGEMELIK